MKRLAETQHAGRLHHGYIAACSICGLRVVHAVSTGEPFAMHGRSFLCARMGAERREVASFMYNGRKYATTAKKLSEYEGAKL